MTWSLFSTACMTWEIRWAPPGTCSKRLAPDGAWMLVEPFAHDRVEDNLNPIGRIFYAASTMICTPASLAQEVGLGLGTQAGEKRLREVVTRAGFAQFRRATQTPFNLDFRGASLMPVLTLLSSVDFIGPRRSSARHGGSSSGRQCRPYYPGENPSTCAVRSISRLEAGGQNKTGGRPIGRPPVNSLSGLVRPSVKVRFLANLGRLGLVEMQSSSPPRQPPRSGRSGLRS